MPGETKETMHCPHAVQRCTTCENSAAARELRDLRRVARSAQRLLQRYRSEGSCVCDSNDFIALESMLEMATETSPSLRELRNA